jgi:hypothetical protein
LPDKVFYYIDGIILIHKETSPACHAAWQLGFGNILQKQPLMN